VANTFLLDIVTPEKSILSESVVAVRLPVSTGSLGIMAGHAPLLADLGIGECVIQRTDGKNETLVLAGGFVEVSRTKVTVLSDTAEFAHEIDVDRAEASLSKAREMLASLEGTGREEASAALQRAQARLRIARGS
jgi:F-type H+-transporting ATPase subunit epsilon